jgi:hypothetical protein
MYMEEQEKSASGAPIFRHQEKENSEFKLAIGNEETIEGVSAHIEKYIGKIDNVFHELISELVHLDIHIVNPTTEKPYYTIITSGMSDLPMTVPNQDVPKYAELLICLPPDWKIGEDEYEDENNYWPIRWLKILARLPHNYDTFLIPGHTVPNGDPAEPFASNTELTTMLLMNPILCDEGFRTLQLKDRLIHFYCLIPLYNNEVELKLSKGTEALYDGFNKNNVSELLDVKRPNLIKKKWLGLF